MIFSENRYPLFGIMLYMKQANVAALVGPWQATSSRQKNLRASRLSWGGAQYCATRPAAPVATGCVET